MGWRKLLSYPQYVNGEIAALLDTAHELLPIEREGLDADGAVQRDALEAHLSGAIAEMNGRPLAGARIPDAHDHPLQHGALGGARCDRPSDRDDDNRPPHRTVAGRLR